VAGSFADGFSSMATNINGTHDVLAALRELEPKCKFYFAGSSEMFGKVQETPQNENTPFHPRSPYGISTCAGFQLSVNYREGMVEADLAANRSAFPREPSPALIARSYEPSKIGHTKFNEASQAS
jgi:GDP-D-mannose dehydratase